jgi:endonuclease/exonuclease/phosphatase family metal-dependent hydrolase
MKNIFYISYLNNYTIALYMKHLPTYMWLSFVLAMASCKCGANKDENKHRDEDKTHNKSLTMLICTANIQFFKTNTAQVVLKALDGLRQDQDDIVVFGLQETEAGHLQEIQKAVPAYKVYDYRPNHPRHSNIVAIYNNTQFKIEHGGIVLPKYGKTQRYATIIKIPEINFSLANTHLFGGRFDDELWYLFPNARNEQIKKILNDHPTIVLGDFNADNEPPKGNSGYWGQKLKSYILHKNCTVEEARAALEAYQCSVHADLEKENYVSLLTREGMKATSTGFLW